MSPTLRTVFWRVVALCVGIRVILQVLGMISVAAHGQAVWPNALEMWSHWDAPHYLRIAEVGYVPDTPVPEVCLGPDKPVHPCDDHLFIVFFPFFPTAVAFVGFVLRNLIASGIVVSLAASVGAAWFLYRLVSIDRGHDEGWRAVLLLLSFPTAYFLAAPYSEALFLFAVVASMYAARTGLWLQAGVAGALATGTRVTGIALVPGLLAEVIVQRRDRLRRAVFVAIAFVGISTYLAINQIVHDNPFHFLDVQRSHWYQHLIPPSQSIADAVRAIVTGSDGQDAGFIYWGRLAGFAFAAPVLVLGARRLRVPDSIYAWIGFVFILSASWLISLPRYLLVLYPLFMVGAGVIRSRRAMGVAIAAGSVVQVWLFWRYAAGAWTF